MTGNARQGRRRTLALKVLRRFRPDVIVTDLIFPSGALDGHAFIQVLRQRRWVPNPVIIVVSGSAQPQDVRRARNAGANAFLIKPCFPEPLLNEIQRCFQAQLAGRVEG